MVCTADDLQEWKDFPKGLRVLLLDEDGNSASEIKPKLEEMDYIVCTFYNESEASSAITSRPDSFHVAIVEVSESNSEGHLKFLRNAKDLPTVITSNVHSLNLMMKCIALGAVEFMRKPLSEDKLKNIWQHVVHKAFNSGTSGNSKTLKPVKESLVSILQLRKEDEVHDKVYCDNAPVVDEMDYTLPAGNDKYPAPSTPQIEHGSRSRDDGTYHDQKNCSIKKEGVGQDGKSKSADTTFTTRSSEASSIEKLPICMDKTMIREEEDMGVARKSDNETYLHSEHLKDLSSIIVGHTSPSKASILSDSKEIKADRKKAKVDWTPELHEKFVQAVKQLGFDQAIPSRILELMKVEGLTRHNVASHLQKYRMHKRHILPKENECRWLHQSDQKQKCYYQRRPIMAFSHCYPSQTLPTAPVYPVWGQSVSYPPSVQMWGSPGNPSWQPQESWIWKSPSVMNADAWGCLVMSPSQTVSFHPQHPLGFHNTNGFDYSSSMPQNSFLLDQTEEAIDKVVKEVISKPWLPLPLGLKPPSTDTVIAELYREGISITPPCTNTKLLCHDQRLSDSIPNL